MAPRGACLLTLLAACASEAEYIRLGDQLVSQSSFEPAQAEYFKALELNPESQPAHLGLGIVYLYTGRFDEAEQAIERARRIEDSERAIVTLSILRHQQKKHAEAAALLREALAKTPRSAALHYRLGLVQLDAGDVTSAADSLQTAVTLDPELLDGYASLATALKRLKRYQEALDTLTEARKRFKGKNVAEIHTSLGEVYEAMNMADYAQHAYQQALKRDPTNVAAMAGLARSMRVAGSYTEAIEMLQAGVRAQPKSPVLHLELGMTFKEFRLAPQAIEALMLVTELDPMRREPYPLLIELLGDNGKTGDLFKVLGKAVKALPDDASVQLRFGKAAYDKKDDAGAIAACKRTIALEPSNVEANYLLGLAQTRSGARDEALETYEALKYLDPAKAEALLASIEKGGDDAVKDKARKKKAPRGKRKRR